MRLLANLIVALTLIWPAPLAVPSVFAASGDVGASHALHADAAQHAGHEVPPAADHRSGHMPDCCVGSACFSLAPINAISVPFFLPRGPLVAREVVHLAATSSPPELPPPRL